MENKYTTEDFNMWNNNADRLGDKNPFFGKHHTEETRLKISEKMSNGNHPRARTICDNTGRTWTTIKDCAEELGTNKDHLSSMLKGNTNFTKKLKTLDLKYV